MDISAKETPELHKRKKIQLQGTIAFSDEVATCF